MADVTTTTSPVRIGEADTWAGTLGAFARGSDNVSDWIDTMSPSGASVYDTGWITTGYTAATSPAFTVTSFRVRRQGNQAMVYVVGTLATLSIGVSSDVANTIVVTVPSGFVPGFTQPLGMGESGRLQGGFINGSGQILLSAYAAQATATTTEAATTVQVSLGGTYFLG